MESNDLMNGVPNGNYSMKRKKLQPISNCVNIYDLRKLMGSWKMAGITYAQMLKVLRLYLGETGWMDIDGRYPYNNLYQIARGMKFDSVTSFYKCIQHCEGSDSSITMGLKMWNIWRRSSRTCGISPIPKSKLCSTPLFQVLIIIILILIIINIIISTRNRGVPKQRRVQPLSSRFTPTLCSISCRMREPSNWWSRRWMMRVWD